MVKMDKSYPKIIMVRIYISYEDKYFDFNG